MNGTAAFDPDAGAPVARRAGSPAGVGRPERLFCAFISFVGVAAALAFFAARGSLWEDEIIAITHANQPLPLFFVEILRHDIHPPLYFLQLAGWAALVPDGDRWLLANSLAWAALGLVAMFRVARACHGARAAWYATALFAVLPSFAWSAGTLRMYSMLPVLVLFAYEANRRWWIGRAPRALAAMVATEALLVLAHAVEFYFVAFIVAAALAEAAAAGRLRAPQAGFSRSFGGWLVAQAVVGLCILPFAASALLHGSDASAPGTLLDALAAGGSLIGGWKASSETWVRGGGAVVFLALLGCALAPRESRWRTLVLPFGALAVAMTLGFVIKPIFKQPVFAANLLPFLALGAGCAAARFRGARVVACAIAVLLAALAWPVAQRQAPVEAYAAAAAHVRDGARPGDLVVVPSVSTFWGVMRYAVGPRWGEPMRVGEKPNAEWSRIYDRLSRIFGPAILDRLALVPERNWVDDAGVHYLLDTDAVDASRGAGHVWVVTHDRYAGEVRLAPAWRLSTTVAPADFGEGELTVRRFDRR